MRPSGLEIIGRLDGAEKRDVAGKDVEGKGWKGGYGKKRKAVQAQEEEEEVELVTGAVVDASAGAEGVEEVGRGL